MYKIVFRLALLFIIFNGMRTYAYSADINADSCSQSDVLAAISSTNTGDTVSIPAGNCTWSTTVTIPNEKKLAIQGAGKDSTVITMSPVGTAVALNSSGSRLTGIGFIDGKITTNGYDFRIDHCAITLTTAGTGIYATPSITGMTIAKGVIDNNILTNAGVTAGGTLYSLNDGEVQHQLWANDLNLGTDEAVYIEDNTFYKSGFGNYIDSNYGGRYVFRYNTTSGVGYLEAHSSQNNNRATRKWEIYGNIINATNNSYAPLRIRGGTGVIFLNSVIGLWTTNKVLFDTVRNSTSYVADDNITGNGRCDGDNVWDGNTVANGWPCRDQIGRGGDAVQWENDPAGTYTQTLVPAYVWDNRKEANAVVPVEILADSVSYILANRDYYDYNTSFNGTSGVGCGTLAARPVTCTAGVGYWATNQSCSNLTGLVGANPIAPISGTLYKCTATDVWEEYYTPYVYPHPLSGNATITIADSDPKSVDTSTTDVTVSYNIAPPTCKWRLGSVPDASNGTAFSGYNPTITGLSEGENILYVACDGPNNEYAWSVNDSLTINRGATVAVGKIPVSVINAGNISASKVNNGNVAVTAVH